MIKSDKEDALLQKLCEGSKLILEAHKAQAQDVVTALAHFCLQMVLDQLEVIREKARSETCSVIQTFNVIENQLFEKKPDDVVQILNRIASRLPAEGYRWTFSFRREQRGAMLVSVISFEEEQAIAPSKPIEREVKCHEAIRFGRLDELKKLRAEGYPLRNRSMIEAARMGYKEMIEYLIAEGVLWTDRVTLATIDEGRYGILQWAIDRNLSTNNESQERRDLLFLSSVKNKDLKALRNYAKTGHGTPADWKIAAHRAIEGLPDVDAVKAIAICGPRMEKEDIAWASEIALQHGKWETFLGLKALLHHIQDYICGNWIAAVMRTGDLKLWERVEELPEVLIYRRVPGRRGIHCSEAVKSKSLEALKFFASRLGFEFDAQTCFETACMYGVLDVAKYMHSNYHTRAWDGFTGLLACRGHLALLKWAHSVGIDLLPLDEHVVDETVRLGFWNVLHWFMKKQLPFEMTHFLCVKAATLLNRDTLPQLYEIFSEKMKVHGNDMVVWAARKGRVDKVKWLLENGFGSQDLVCKAAITRGRYSLLEWAIREKMHIGRSCLKTAIEYGELDCLKLLVKNDVKMFERDLSLAFERKRWVMAKWMIENGCPCRPLTIARVHPKDVYPFDDLKTIVGELKTTQ